MGGGNLALRDHIQNNKTVHLFEYVASGIVRFKGEVTYLGHHEERRPDREGNWRNAFVFELAVDSPASSTTDQTPLPVAEPKYWSMPASELRALAKRAPLPQTNVTQRRQVVRQRSEAVRIYVLRRADGICEGCGVPAPFKEKKRRPYLEPHHIHRIADGGPDDPAHVIALCPNCHRRVHHGMDGAEYNQSLAECYSRSKTDPPMTE